MCVAIVGAVVSGLAAVAGIQQRNQQAELQAQLYERQAKLLRTRGAYEGARKVEEVKRAAGQQRAGLAASGVSLADGSALDVQTDTLTEGNLDIAAIRWNADAAAATEKFKAKMERSSKSGGFATAAAFAAPIIKVAGDIQTGELSY